MPQIQPKPMPKPAQGQKPASGIVALVEQQRGKFEASLPEFVRKHADRFFDFALACLDDQFLAQAEPLSIVQAVLDSARLGIPADRRHGAIVRYGSKAQFVAMYPGLLAAVRRSSKIELVWTDVVYRDEKFHVQRGTHPRIDHEISYDVARTDDRIVAFYACVKWPSGDVDFEVRSIDQVLAIRDRVLSKSKRPDLSPYTTAFVEMGKKAPLRALCKRQPLSPELQEFIGREEAAEEGEREAEFEVVGQPPADLSALAAREQEGQEPAPEAEFTDSMPWDAVLGEEAPTRVVCGVTVPMALTWDAVKGRTFRSDKVPLLNGKTWEKIVHDQGLLGTVGKMVSAVAAMELKGVPIEERLMEAPVAYEVMCELYPEA